MNKRTKIPMYKQIRSDLLQEIIESNYASMKLPTEAELCKRYNVSRMTVNKALSILVHDGIIRRIPGKGSYTNPSAIQKRFSESNGFSQHVSTIGEKPGSRLLSFKKLSAKEKPDMATLFQLEEDDYLYFFERLRTADDVPLAVTTTYISGRVVPDLPKKVLEGSFYSYLREDCNINPKCSDYQIRAREATETERSFLETDEVALLVVSHISYTQEDIPFEYNDSAYLGDKFFYVSSSGYHPRIKGLDTE